MDMTIAIAAVSFLFLVIVILAVKRPILLRMGIRNMTRRKVRATIVVIGLLVGTATISSSLVIGDTLEYIFLEDVYQRLDAIDEMLYNQSGRDYIPFSLDYFSRIRASVEENNTPIDGIAPIVVITTAGLDVRSGVGKQGIILIGLNGTYEGGFGDFEAVDGQSIGISDLGVDEAIVIERTAEDLDVEVGDTLTVFQPTSHNLTVRFIARNSGKADFQKEDNIFVRLETAQMIMGLPGYINAIKISNEGGVQSGVDLTDEVRADLEAAVRVHGAPFFVDPVKKRGVDDAIEFSEDVTEIFLIMGTFAIIAGILLIINIFVMLAEERKSEIGVVRAVGMKRSHLTQTFLFEGMAYAILSALLGTFLGVGIGYLILYAFSQIFPVAEMTALTFRFTPDSLFLAFVSGMMITFSTVVIASWRVSRLNIVRAIRDLPEPPATRLRLSHVAISALALITGISLTWMGYTESSGTTLLVGPPFVMIGIAILFSRYGGGRIPFTLAGVGIVAWVLAPLGYINGSGDDIHLLFIATGLLLVLGSILIVIFNSSVILKALLLAGGRKKARPVLRTALSYPMGKKFRTAMTLSMFSLIIFTVTVIAMIENMQAEGLEDIVEVESGGFDIVASPYRYAPLSTFIPMLENSSLDMEDFAGISSLTLKNSLVTEPDGDSVTYYLFGTDQTFSSQNEYTFHSLLTHYHDEAGIQHEIESGEDAWWAIQENASLAIVDGNVLGGSQFVEAFGDLRVKLGDVVSAVAADGGSIQVKIIGILGQVLPFTTGLFVGEDALASNFNLTTSMSSYFFKISDHADSAEIAKELESEFLAFGLVVVDIGNTIREAFEVANRVLLLMEGYLGIGLMVGIAGLGVITVRAVVERRQEIGTMRAIGFKRKMILSAFLGEITFVAVLGILIGVLMGILLSYDVWLLYFDPVIDFTIPWLHITGVVLFAYVASLLATFSPARRASRIPPAEALRTKE